MYEFTQVRSQERISSTMTQVYLWMAVGLALSGAVAFFTASTPALVNLIFGTPFVFIGLLIAEVVLVIALSAAIGRMSASMAMAMFLTYAALNGLTLSAIFLIYELGSIVSVFGITAVSFSALSAFGLLTRRDLSGWGKFLFMALIGLLLASIVNIFIASSWLYWLTSYAGVLIFAGLTAYDTQKIRNLALAAQDGESRGRVAVIGALTLYLDFINLLLFLLRILGNRRD